MLRVDKDREETKDQHLQGIQEGQVREEPKGHLLRVLQVTSVLRVHKEIHQ